MLLVFSLPKPNGQFQINTWLSWNVLFYTYTYNYSTRWWQNKIGNSFLRPGFLCQFFHLIPSSCAAQNGFTDQSASLPVLRNVIQIPSETSVASFCNNSSRKVRLVWFTCSKEQQWTGVYVESDTEHSVGGHEDTEQDITRTLESMRVLQNPHRFSFVLIYQLKSTSPPLLKPKRRSVSCSPSPLHRHFVSVVQL